MACFVPHGKSDLFIEWVMSGGFRKANWPLSIPQLDTAGVFLGEHWWSPSSGQQVEEEGEQPLEWSFPQGSDPCTAQLPIASHSTTVSDYDCSVGARLEDVYLPSRALAQGCQLVWSGMDAEYVDTDSNVVAFDPSGHEPGPGALLVRADTLEQYLFDNELELCWAITGEKQTIGTTGQPYGWTELRGAYVYRNGIPNGKSSVEHRPSTDGLGVPEEDADGGGVEVVDGVADLGAVGDDG